MATDKPNRVVIEVKGGDVVSVRAERSSDVVVTILDHDVPLDFTEEGVPFPADVWGDDGIPIGELDAGMATKVHVVMCDFYGDDGYSDTTTEAVFLSAIKAKRWAAHQTKRGPGGKYHWRVETYRARDA